MMFDNSSVKDNIELVDIQPPDYDSSVKDDLKRFKRIGYLMALMIIILFILSIILFSINTSVVTDDNFSYSKSEIDDLLASFKRSLITNISSWSLDFCFDQMTNAYPCSSNTINNTFTFNSCLCPTLCKPSINYSDIGAIRIVRLHVICPESNSYGFVLTINNKISIIQSRTIALDKSDGGNSINIYELFYHKLKNVTKFILTRDYNNYTYNHEIFLMNVENK